MILQSTQLARSTRGFSLIELMVALALGLVMIGAVVTVFVSNQQSARTKQELDRAQEAFRFASHTIMRVVQQGEIQDPGLGQELVVNVSPAPGHSDCLGRPVPEMSSDEIDHVRNIFYFNANHPDRLHCRVETHLIPNDPSPIISDAVIVDGIDSDPDRDRTAFTFGVANVPTGYWSNNALWVPADDVTDWTNVRSVRIQLAMQSEGAAIGPTALFSATMRCGALDIC